MESGGTRTLHVYGLMWLTQLCQFLTHLLYKSFKSNLYNLIQVQERLGYCPQFDALIEQMTVRETLTLFARLRGVDEMQIPGVVVMLVTRLLLQDHIDKQCGDLR